MELTGDIQYINNYGLFWLILYFISTLTGILLISFPVEIDSDDLNLENYQMKTETGKETLVSNEPSTDYGSFEKGKNTTDITKAETGTFGKICKFDLNNETDRDHFRKFLKALLTMVFVDIFFATIRLKVMLTEHSVKLGFNMVVKNLILALLHLLYLSNLFWLRHQLSDLSSFNNGKKKDNGNRHKKKYFTPHKRNKQTKKEELILS